MAMQLAYYRDSGGESCQTYEASMTRFYKHGRTETIRSCSSESAAFVHAMEAGEAGNAELRSLLSAAAEKHSMTAKDAMCGACASNAASITLARRTRCLQRTARKARAWGKCTDLAVSWPPPAS